MILNAGFGNSWEEKRHILRHSLFYQFCVRVDVGLGIGLVSFEL